MIQSINIHPQSDHGRLRLKWAQFAEVSVASDVAATAAGAPATARIDTGEGGEERGNTAHASSSKRGRRRCEGCTASGRTGRRSMAPGGAAYPSPKQSNTTSRARDMCVDCGEDGFAEDDHRWLPLHVTHSPPLNAWRHSPGSRKGGRGGRDPKVCVPKTARPDSLWCKLRFFPRWSLWSGGEEGSGGVAPPPPPLLLWCAASPILPWHSPLPALQTRTARYPVWGSLVNSNTLLMSIDSSTFHMKSHSTTDDSAAHSPRAPGSVKKETCVQKNRRVV